MKGYLQIFWPFDVSYADLPAGKIYRMLRGICLASFVWPVVTGSLLMYFGLALSKYQQWLGISMLMPGGAIAVLIVGTFVLHRDFRPIAAFLDTPPERMDTGLAAEALIRARNFQLLAARRVLLYQAPAFALGFSLASLIANQFLGFGLQSWQLLISLMVALMIGVGHAIFEFYAVANLMVRVITLAHRQCGDLTPEQMRRIIQVDTKHKLLFVSSLVVLPPIIILGTTLLIRIHHHLVQVGHREMLGFMPGMIGWMIVITLIGYASSLLIFLRMASDVSESASELADAMRQVEQGRLNISLLEKTNDEFSDIYRRFNGMVHELMERERLRDAFGRYVARELADDVMKHGINLGGKEVHASVLFADIRDFTAMSEIMSASEVVNTLNRYFSFVEPGIKSEEGWINKFAGDSLLAVFGVLSPQPDHIRRAVQAALNMRQALNEFNAQQQKSGKQPLRIGIGIHCGKMVAGSVGSKERMEFTVIGDTVNMASRIEDLNKQWGTDILVSKAVADSIGHGTTLRPMPEAMVHGISRPIRVFAVK